MKPLYESILKSTNTGRKGIVENWLIENNLSDICTIEKDNTITVKKNNDLYLCYDKYSELPDYIQFNPMIASGTIFIQKKLEPFEYADNITSLRGLPKTADSLVIYSDCKTLSDLDIELWGSYSASPVFEIAADKEKECKFKNFHVKLLGSRNRDIRISVVAKGDIKIDGPISWVYVSNNGTSGNGMKDMFEKELKSIKLKNPSVATRSIGPLDGDKIDSLFNRCFSYITNKNSIKQVIITRSKSLKKYPQGWYLTYE